MNARENDVMDLAHKLAGCVLCSRVKFEEIFDETIAELALKTEKFKIAILDDELESPVEPVDAFRAAFRRAIDDNWHRMLIKRGLQQNALSRSALELVKPQSAAAPVVPAPVGDVIQTQTILNSGEGIEYADAHTSNMHRMTPKICLVKVTNEGKESGGSGFLIGPHAVLTAWHVIQPLIDDKTGMERDGSHNDLKVVFDYLTPPGGGAARWTTYSVMEKWLGDHSKCPDEERPNEDGISSPRLSASKVDADHLDFAVIRIKGAPGRERGVVQMRPDFVKLPAKGAFHLWVFQHPKSFPQGMAPGQLAGFFGAGQPPPRLRHSANTTPGSSGGLCTDTSFKGVGLHQAGVFDAAGKPVANQAVPLAHICKKLLSAKTYSPDLDTIWKLGNDAPVIGRDAFQESVWRATRGEKRVILVRGGPKIGVNFSADILRALRSPNDADIIRISADAIGTSAVTFAERLLELAGRRLKPDDPFPALKDAATADSAWLRDQLVPDLARKIEAGNGGKLVWIVVDNLYTFDPPAGPASDLLFALINAVVDARLLRFLLLGFKGFLPGDNAGLVDEDKAQAPNTTDVQKYIRRFATEHDMPMSANELNRQVGYFMNAINKEPNQNPWRVAAQYASETFAPVMLGRN